MNFKTAIKGVAILAGMAIFSGAYADAPHWTYDEQKQPGGWGSITGTETPPPLDYPYAECAIGGKQTPIDLSGAVRTPVINRLTFNWPKMQTDFFNTGHAIQIQPVDPLKYAGTTKVGSDVYPLLQAHLHAPAEHIIGAKTFDAEMHFVHIRNDGRITVVGILINVGQENREIQTILDNMPNVPDVKTHNKTNIMINPKAFLPKGNGKFLTYSGSLTTPPCTEGVNWYVFQNPITLSSAQLAQLKSFYNGNNRDVQLPNGRQVVTDK